MADEEHELLLDNGKDETTAVEGVIVQLSKRDSASVVTRPASRRKGSPDTEVCECKDIPQKRECSFNKVR